VRGAALAAVAVVAAFTVPTLAAQKLTDRSMPLPETSQRQRQLEPPVAAGGGANAPMYEVWRVGASPELLLGWYLRSLNRLSPVMNAVLDTADVMMGNTRPPVSYHITMHRFKDECVDPVDTTIVPSDTTHQCKRWRSGKQKLHTLDNNRVGYGLGDWIERITFFWYIREVTGELVRREIELRDTGLSDDWKRYTLVTQITLRRDVLEPATPSP
jgi:hypothetical protein